MLSILTAFIFVTVFTSMLSLCFGADAVLAPVRFVRQAYTLMGSKRPNSLLPVDTGAARRGKTDDLSWSKLDGPRWA